MRKCISRTSPVALIFLAVSLAPVTLSAQESRGTLLGRVTDPSGAVLTNVSVEAVNTATGVAIGAVTNNEGNYRIPYLLAGQYRVTFTLSGFQKLVRDKVDIQIAGFTTLDVGLTVGELSQQVTVEGEVPPLEVSSASLGQVVDRQRIQELPFREGNPHELMKMAPGVSTSTHLRLMKPGMTGVLSENSVDGSTTRRTEFALDGIANTAGDRVAYSPPSAAVQELKVQTSTYDAGLGFTSGGVVNLVTRNGTNEFHGEAWYFYRNSRFDSKDFMQTVSNQPKPQYTDKRGGFALGGPIRRDKAHFFVATEFNPYLNPFSFNTTVPTPKMRNGDFSEAPRDQLYDPLSGRLDPASPGRIVRNPIPGNIIPANRISPISRKLVDLWPLPNRTGLTSNFQHPNSVENHDWKTVTSRADYQFSSANRAFVRYSEARWDYRDPDYHLNQISSGHTTKRTQRLVAIDDVHTLSPAMLLNMRFGYTYQRDVFDLFSSGVNLNDYGLGAIAKLSSTPDRLVLPLIQVSGMTGWRQALGAGNSTDNIDRLYSGSATLNYIRGNHTFAMGFEYRHYNEYSYNDARYRSPVYHFGAGWSVGPYNTSAGVNHVHATGTFMMGYPTGGSMTVMPPREEVSPRSALFLQDDWRVSRKLTLNLGLRYELERPATEANDASVNGIDLTTPLPIEAAVKANYAKSPLPERSVNDFNIRGGILYAGVGGRRRGLWDTRRTNFMPRIGAAYQIDAKTVLRGGFGIFYDSLGVTRSNADQTGFSRATILQTTLDSITPRTDAFANPFPSGLLQPVGNSLGLMTNVGNAISAPYEESVKTPYGQRISFGLQRRMPLGFVVEATYAANSGRNLPVSTSFDALPYQYLSRSMTRDQDTINFLSARFPNPFYGILSTSTSMGSSTNTTRSQLLRPYAQYTNITMSRTIGKSWYDSLQVRVDRRMANGLTINMSYTWSKALQQTAYRDASEPGPEKTYSGGDRPHALQVNGIYEVPVGKGRRWGRSWNRPADALLGGWQASLMYRMEAGYPLPIGNVLLQPGATFADLPVPGDQRTYLRQFNIDAFNRVPAQQLGSNVRYYSTRTGNVRYMGFDMLDIRLSKKFRLTERVSVSLLGECYNALNATNLMNLDTSPTSPSFGQLRSVNGYARQYQLSIRGQF